MKSMAKTVVFPTDPMRDKVEEEDIINLLRF